MEKFKDQINKNINNTKVYKNKSISENYWIKWNTEMYTMNKYLKIWRPLNIHTFIEMTWFGVKWPKKGHKTKQLTNYEWMFQNGFFYRWNIGPIGVISIPNQYIL